MAIANFVGQALAWVFLLPGNLACDAIGVSTADNRDLVRMLVNSLVWMFVAIPFVFLAV